MRTALRPNFLRQCDPVYDASSRPELGGGGSPVRISGIETDSGIVERPGIRERAPGKSTFPFWVLDDVSTPEAPDISAFQNRRRSKIRLCHGRRCRTSSFGASDVLDGRRGSAADGPPSGRNPSMRQPRGPNVNFVLPKDSDRPLGVTGPMSGVVGGRDVGLWERLRGDGGHAAALGRIPVIPCRSSSRTRSGECPSNQLCRLPQAWLVAEFWRAKDGCYIKDNFQRY